MEKSYYSTFFRENNSFFSFFTAFFVFLPKKGGNEAKKAACAGTFTGRDMPDSRGRREGRRGRNALENQDSAVASPMGGVCLWSCFLSR